MSELMLTHYLDSPQLPASSPSSINMTRWNVFRRSFRLSEPADPRFPQDGRAAAVTRRRLWINSWFVSQAFKEEPKDNGKSGIMDFVSCSGTEASLWHCRAKRQGRSFPCKQQAYVVCAGNVWLHARLWIPSFSRSEQQAFRRRIKLFFNILTCRVLQSEVAVGTILSPLSTFSGHIWAILSFWIQHFWKSITL